MPRRYCPHCGQDTRTRAPTVGEFVREFAGNYLVVEGALWRTLHQLLLHPGALTRAYLAGRRRHYVRPLRLYLSISLLVLLGMGLLFQREVQRFTARDIVVEQSHFVVFDLGVARAGMDRGRFYCEGAPAFYCRRLQQTLAGDPAALWRSSAAGVQRLIGNLGTAMFLLVPAFALLMRLAFAGQRWRYAEHLVFALHLHSFWFLVLALAGVALPVPVLGAAVWLLVPVYALWAARQVYGGTWVPLMLRLVAVTLGYVLLLGLALTVLLLWALVA